MQEVVENVKKQEIKEANRKSAVEKANNLSKAAKIRAAAYALKTKKFYNPYDGTFHMPDGSREFMDESKVEGVNNYHQTHNHAHDQMKMEAKIQAIENINARMMKN